MHEQIAMTNKVHTRFSAEFRTRAVQTVLDQEGQHPSRWAAVVSIAPRIGCAKQTLDNWVRKAEARPRPLAVHNDRALNRQLKLLEKENRKLRKVNNILRKASAYFALAELER